MTFNRENTQNLCENVIEYLSDPLYVINDKFEILLINRALKKWLKVLGFNTNLIGVSIFEAFSFLSQKVFDEYDYVLREGEPLFTEEETSISNEIITIVVSKIPIIRDGKVVQIITILRNITKRKKVEQKLKESELKYRNLLDNLDVGFFQVTLDGHMLNSNRAHNIILGYDPSESLKDKDVRDFWQNPEDRDEYLRYLLKNDFAKDYTCHALKKNGEKIVVELNSHLIRDEKENPIRIDGTFIDITEKYNLGQKLKESEHQLRERVKELNCLYGISTIAERSNISYEELISETLNLIPFAWQFPKIICARIYYKGNEFKSENFKETNWKLTTHIDINKKQMDIDVFYLENKPFLSEEENVIIEIGKRLKNLIEKKESEEKLEESEEKYRSFIEQSRDGVVLVNEKGKIIEWNKGQEQLLGLKREEIIGEDLWNVQFNARPSEFQEKERTARLKMSINQALKTGEAPWLNILQEIQIQDHEGKDLTIQQSPFLIKTKKGYMLGMISRNITELKAAEQKLKDSEIRFRDLYEEAPNGYFSIRTDKSIIRTNKAAERLLGYTKDEFLKLKVLDLYADTKYGLERAKKVFKQFLKGETIRDVELQMKKKNGDSLWVSLSVKPIFDPEGNVVESRSMVLDITERKNAEKALRESEEKFRRIFETIPDLFFLVSGDSTILDFKGNIEDLYLPPEEFFGKKIIDIFPENIATLSLNSIKKAIETQMPQIIEYNLEINGVNRFFEARNLYYSNDRVLSFVRDITERKYTEEALLLSEKNYREAYDQANFYKDLFAHDISNILQVINSSAELISYHLGESEKSKDVKNISDIIKKQVERGSKLVSNVRTLSELEEEEISIKPTKICNSLKKSIEFIKKAYNDREVNIFVDSNSKEYSTNANELLQDVFENILINGIKYNDHSKVDFLIKISNQKIDDINYLKIEFIDNGIGIPDDRKDIIFKRGRRELKGSKGMGLGLSLVSRILNIFNGKIWVENRVKEDHTKGSNFIILLPELK